MNFISSPNFWKGREELWPTAIVIHRAEGTFKGTIAWFKSKKSKVSSHYVIALNGEVVQMVKDADSAWHCGRVKEPKWLYLKESINPNLYTIGVELEGFAGNPAPFVQLIAAARLLETLAARHDIVIDINHIITHNSICSDKLCPGKGVDMEWLIERAASLNTKRK